MDTAAKGWKVGLAMAGLLAAMGVAAGGWFSGQGLTRFKTEYRSVTVKGLVEREAPADEATWQLFPPRERLAPGCPGADQGRP